MPMLDHIDWSAYLASSIALEETRNRIAAIGQKTSPTLEELDSLKELLRQVGEAEEFVRAAEDLMRRW